MTIRTNFTNLKGNTIRLVSATEGSGAGDDTTVIIGEYISGTTDLFQAPAGTCTIDGNDTTTTENQCLDLSGTWVVAVDGSVLDATRTFNVQGGKRGVKFFSWIICSCLCNWKSTRRPLLRHLYNRTK